VTLKCSEFEVFNSQYLTFVSNAACMNQNKENFNSSSCSNCSLNNISWWTNMMDVKLSTTIC